MISANEIAEMRAELDALREGLGQVFFDKPKVGGPFRIVSDGEGGTVGVYQLTHQGTPAWICGNCVRLTIAASAPAACGNCGAEMDSDPYALGKDEVPPCPHDYGPGDHHWFRCTGTDPCTYTAARE